ncbi:hypothetical protein HPB47_012120, partial [Ixodes persulcatus]
DPNDKTPNKSSGNSNHSSKSGSDSGGCMSPPDSSVVKGGDRKPSPPPAPLHLHLGNLPGSPATPTSDISLHHHHSMNGLFGSELKTSTSTPVLSHPSSSLSGDPSSVLPGTTSGFRLGHPLVSAAALTDLSLMTISCGDSRGIRLVPALSFAAGATAPLDDVPDKRLQGRVHVLHVRGSLGPSPRFERRAPCLKSARTAAALSVRLREAMCVCVFVKEVGRQSQKLGSPSAVPR